MRPAERLGVSERTLWRTLVSERLGRRMTSSSLREQNGTTHTVRLGALGNGGNATFVSARTEPPTPPMVMTATVTANGATGPYSWAKPGSRARGVSPTAPTRRAASAPGSPMLSERLARAECADPLVVNGPEPGGSALLQRRSGRTASATARSKVLVCSKNARRPTALSRD